MTQNTLPESQESSLEEQAAAWFLRIQNGDCSDAERQEFETWLVANPDHRREYQQYVRLWSHLDQVGDVTASTRRRKTRTGIALVALAVIFGATQWVTSREETLVTAVGERRHLVLADGTAVDMNTATTLRVQLYGLTRKVRLEQGEALFDVAHNVLRPFEVLAGNGTLRDIGTSFNVARENGTTTVAVLEGEVQVRLNDPANATAILRGGEELAYSERGLSEISPLNAAATTAWREGRLVFYDTPLDEVVRQINRYHTRPIALADARLGRLKVSGEFNAADREGLIRALKILFPLRSEERGEVTTFSPRPQGQPG